MLVSKEKFMDWLKREDYKDWTESGYPSTIFQYIRSIESVMKKEAIETFSDLTQHIQLLIRKYGPYGPMKEYGSTGHNTVINALKRFMDFLINEYDFKPSKKMYFV